MPCRMSWRFETPANVVFSLREVTLSLLFVSEISPFAAELMLFKVKNHDKDVTSDSSMERLLAGASKWTVSAVSRKGGH